MHLYSMYEHMELDKNQNLTNEMLGNIKNYISKYDNPTGYLNSFMLDINGGLGRINISLPKWQEYTIYLKTQLFPNTYPMDPVE